jgi:peptidyl-prolyl cis-trans isomerase-like protein 2
MGKNQHGKDKMYVTQSEHRDQYGGVRDRKPHGGFRRLPFDACSISLAPFVDPVMSPDGTIFEITNM